MSTESDWEIVSPLEAHQALKTHDVEDRCADGPWRTFCGYALIVNGSWQYRIREKVVTISVEIPKPLYAPIEHYGCKEAIRLDFGTTEQRDTALAAFRAAMEKV